ncbi:dipicolinate synthase subunit B [Sporobacter termitidis DSM 10068]|uniref:Dipicolinate synthase subunit B n=1 Tax=Sporobacter termitidis DSM 10068 TaxID=1123282 RepID=A0A1M5Z649_9FIRM|nr:dipicolinate synthase subunit B [Sporobacter termitidis]SHI19363.1 dipicolinate synthase subunit B [Sporobacter termitidis DSM 10068]
MIEKSVGYAFCGSYCTFDKAIESLEKICGIYKSVTPIMSENAYKTDSRFGPAQGFIDKIEALCGKKIVSTIPESEPFGPKALLDLLIIAPCTGNTIAKLAGGITDTSVTMAAKAHLRNGRPVLIAVSTNDGLSGNASNVGLLLNRKNYFFVPFYQDDPVKKPTSITADFDLLPAAAEAALQGVQLQPMLLSSR